VSTGTSLAAPLQATEAAAAVSRPLVRATWPRLLAFALALATAITALELWAWWRPPAGMAFLGSFWATEDVAAYWSAMREAAGQAGWLVHDRLTSEPHAPALVYPLYLAAAKVGAMLGASIEAAYIGFAWLGRLFFLIALGALVAALVERGRRLVAYALALAGGGFAFLVLLIAATMRRPDLVGEWAVDWRYVELSTFLALFSYPHVLVSLGALAFLLVVRLQLDERVSARGLAMLATTTSLMALANSFALVPTAIALAAYGLWRVATRSAVLRRELAIGLVFLLVATPFLLYSWRTFGQDPFWATVYGDQNVPHLLTPSLLPLLSGLGLLIPLGFIGAVTLVRERPGGWSLVLLWTLVLFALMLLPLPYQRRYGLGMPMLLALLAARGLATVTASGEWRRLSGGLRRLGGYAAVVALFSSALGVVVLVLTLLITGRGAVSVMPAFERASVVDASRWLAGHSTREDVVLAEWRTANVALRYIPGRAFSGHPIATLEAEAKEASVRRFFDATTVDSERESFLRTRGVTLIIVGPRERASGDFDPGGSRYVERIYANDEVVIYRVDVRRTP